MIGLDAQIQMDSDSTYTITNCFGMRIKMQVEDGATVTTGYGLKIEIEAVTGGPTGNAQITAMIGASATSATDGVFRYGIDSSGTEFANGAAGEVVLWKFQDAAGTTQYLIHDTDAATVLEVSTTDPTS